MCRFHDHLVQSTLMCYVFNRASIQCKFIMKRVIFARDSSVVRRHFLRLENLAQKKNILRTPSFATIYLFLFENFLENFMFLPFIILKIFLLSQLDISDSQYFPDKTW